MAEVNENRLTLNDMHVSYDSEVYEFMREAGATIEWHPTYDSNGKRGIMEANVKMIAGWYSPMSPLLYRHIIAEQLLADYKNVNWYDATDCYYTPRIIMTMAELWMHPLVDCTWETMRELAIEGAVAKEAYAPDRKNEVRKALEHIFYGRVLWFADHPLQMGEDALCVGVTKSMLVWFFLTQGYEDLIEKVLNGEFLEEADYKSCEPFNIFVLRNNLNYIAKERGGITAAKLLRKLQEQWSEIKLWGSFGLDEMDEEDIARFEKALFHGYDELLKEWEKDKEEEVVTEGNRFSLLTDTCIAEGKEAKVISELRAACKGTAPALWKVIRTNEALGYLGTRDLEASVIYRTFTEYFGKLPYTERNFRDARGKV